MESHNLIDIIIAYGDYILGKNKFDIKEKGLGNYLLLWTISRGVIYFICIFNIVTDRPASAILFFFESLFLFFIAIMNFCYLYIQKIVLKRDEDDEEDN